MYENLKGTKILFADDETATLDAYVWLAKYYGMFVETASTVEKTIELVNTSCGREDKCFDCIVSDINFDKNELAITGITAAKEIRKQIELVPIIFLSGHNNSIIREEVRRVDNAELLQKPVDVDVLFSFINVAIIRYHLQMKHDSAIHQSASEPITLPASIEAARDASLASKFKGE